MIARGDASRARRLAWHVITLLVPCGCVIVQDLGHHEGVVNEGCDVEDAVFCETFDVAAPGGRGGDVDERRWAVSRYPFLRVRASSLEPGYDAWSNPDGPPVLCGAPLIDVLPPDDLRICGGRLEETLNDHGNEAVNAMMILQPFDFADRTGVLSFDVDAKRPADSFDAGWWIEVWITEDPTPIPGAGGVRRGVGIVISLLNDLWHDQPSLNGVSNVLVVDDYAVSTPLGTDGAMPFRVRDGALNRFRVEVARDAITVYASDFDAPDSFARVLTLYELDLGFTRGYVHLTHRHDLGAEIPLCDCEVSDCDGRCAAFPSGFFRSPTQVFRWDNVGFDGPVLPSLRTFAATDAWREETLEDEGVSRRALDMGIALSAGIPERLEVLGVTPIDGAETILMFNQQSDLETALRFRLNAGAWQDVAAAGEPGIALRSFAVPIDGATLRAGANTVDFDGDDPIGNVTLSIVAR